MMPVFKLNFSCSKKRLISDFSLFWSVGFIFSFKSIKLVSKTFKKVSLVAFWIEKSKSLFIKLLKFSCDVNFANKLKMLFLFSFTA